MKSSLRNFLSLSCLEVFILCSMIAVGSEKNKPQPTTNRNIAIPILNKNLLRRGELIYKTNCKTCHAKDGSGKTFTGSTLVIRPRDLRYPDKFIAGHTVESIIDTFTNGLRRNGLPTGMAGWKIKRLEDRYALAYFVRSFAKGTPEHKLRFNK